MATPNIVPRADQEGGLGTPSKSWGKLFIENPTSGGTSAARISNLDVDEIALDINATANTTGNVIDISTSSLTTGKGLYLVHGGNSLESDGRLFHILHLDGQPNTQVTTSNQMEYKTTVSTVSSVTSTKTNLELSMDNVGSGNSGTINYTGLNNNLAILNNGGINDNNNITQIGIHNTVLMGTVANNVGLYSQVADGGMDVKFVSTADTGDYFSIATGAAGATTITTVDDDGTAANLTFDIDGDLAIDNAGGDTFFYNNGNTDDFLKLRITSSGGADFSTTDAAGTDADINFIADGKTKAIIGSGSTTNTFAVQTTTASNPAFEFFGEDGVDSKLRIYEKAGATTDDYCEIQVLDRGVTTIKTVDGAGSQRAILALQPDGDLIFTDVTGNNSNDVVREVKMGTGFVTIVAEVDIFDANTTDHGVIKQIGTVQIPQFARIKSVTIIVKELSNLATYNFELGLGTNNGVSAGTVPANYKPLLDGSTPSIFSYGTDDVLSDVGPNIGSGSGNLKKQFFSGRGREDVLQTNGELSADSFLYIVSEGTSNGTTDATAGRILVYLDYYGLF
tara:strand:+ start:258 stop:1952 length:1695 start_codon:yes stop_codon:yes gene_type:complete